MKESVLEVPGARLHHFVRGSGPLLVLVAGGHGDTTVTDALSASASELSIGVVMRTIAPSERRRCTLSSTV